MVAQDREATLNAGFDYHLAKPTDYRQVLSLIRNPAMSAVSETV